MGAPNPVMAVHDELMRFPSGDLAGPIGQLGQRDQDASRQGHKVVLIGLADIKETERLPGAQTAGDLAGKNRGWMFGGHLQALSAAR